jgi:4-hydroxythreonine-4-phosphate dehydrogenase
LKPIIAITMGDPAGIGPELCLKAVSDSRLREICTPVIYGDRLVLQRVMQTCGPTDELSSRNKIGMITDIPDSLWVIDLGGTNSSEDLSRIQPGQVNALTGQASFNYVEAAIRDSLSGRVKAVVTGPINKEAWGTAGIPFPGHTELFADRCGTKTFCMLMTSSKISCALVTCHVGLGEVPSLLTRERVLEVIVLTYQAMKRMRGREPRLIVLGLNPHAGEQGLFGNREEETIIEPAIAAAREQGLEIEGPLPPDTAFLPWKLKHADAHVCMYHDQGLIPFKALAFDTGINTTLGLPIVRTSVDHGTALDIAWQGKADASSMLAAVELAAKLAAG